MYLRGLPIFILFFINFSLLAQQSKDFMGYWTYDMVVSDVQQDSSEYKLVENLYHDLYILFKKNGQYSSLILNRNESGHWKYKDKTIKLRSSQGAIIEMKIIDVAPDVLIIQFANETFKLKRNTNFPLSVSNSEDLVEEPKKKKKTRKKRQKQNKKI